MDFVIRPTGDSPINALRLLAESITRLGLPEDWLCVASPISIVLTAPEAKVSENGDGWADDEAMKLGKAWLLVRSACEGRDDIELRYFSIGRT